MYVFLEICAEKIRRSKVEFDNRHPQDSLLIDDAKILNQNLLWIAEFFRYDDRYYTIIQQIRDYQKTLFDKGCNDWCTVEVITEINYLLLKFAAILSGGRKVNLSRIRETQKTLIDISFDENITFGEILIINNHILELAELIIAEKHNT
jgi:hypothetical protein